MLGFCGRKTYERQQAANNKIRKLEPAQSASARRLDRRRSRSSRWSFCRRHRDQPCHGQAQHLYERGRAAALFRPMSSKRPSITFSTRSPPWFPAPSLPPGARRAYSSPALTMATRSRRSSASNDDSAAHRSGARQRHAGALRRNRRLARALAIASGMRGRAGGAGRRREFGIDGTRFLRAVALATTSARA